MKTEDWQQASCFLHSAQDAKLFAEWTSILPLRKETTPYHCGPHSLRAIRAICNLVAPRNVLEIGFCLGHSASIWLNFCAETLTSIDNSERPETLEAAGIMRRRYGEAFEFVPSKSFRARDPVQGFDFAFIDGGHEFEDVNADIQLCRSLGIQRMAFDDYFPQWGPGVQKAIADNGLAYEGIFGNIALCVTEQGWLE